MLNLIRSSCGLMFTISAISLALVSQTASAEIYKWRDAGGRTQYSDKPPVEGFSKATHQEIINALQSKELCAIAPKTNILKTASTFKASFFGFGTSASANSISGGSNPNTGLSSIVGSSNRTRSVATLYSPLNPNNTFNVDGKKVTAFNSPVKAPPKPIAAAPQPSPASTTAASPVPKPVAAAPAPTNVATAPSTAPAPTAPASNLIQVAQMPAVDISKNMLADLGSTKAQITTAHSLPTAGAAFRNECHPSHMSNDDPIVYPNQQGAAHHHTFFGNTSTNFKSDVGNMSASGNSTCVGGTSNRSAYWVPSMIDTATNTPIAPTFAIFYYKGPEHPEMIQAPPKGLRMISGNAKATNDTTASNHEFTCYTDANGAVFHGWQKSIPNCTILGEELFMHVYFPDCWDGVNLDSPDHKSHMANKNKALANNLANGCPATHPVLIPTITFGLKWKVQPGQTKTWRLASDNYDKTLPGGYSGHGDWINGWDEVIMSGIVKNCLNKDLDAAGGLLCDGRMFAYGT